jgi:hypothetical protein
MNDNIATNLAQLLHQVGEVHHVVFADTDGNDEDWATFYSDWLLAHSELPHLLGHTPIRSHLTSDLVQLDQAYTAASPSEPWPNWYAHRLIEKYR